MSKLEDKIVAACNIAEGICQETKSLTSNMKIDYAKEAVNGRKNKRAVGLARGKGRNTTRPPQGN